MYKSFKSLVAATLVCIAFPFVVRAQQYHIYPSPSSLAFGFTVVGTGNAGQQVNLQNGTPYFVSISSITANGEFEITGNNCGSGIAFAQHCTITVSFVPTVAGKTTGSAVVKYTVPQGSGGTVYTLTIPLTGEGFLGGFVNPKYLIMGVWYDPPGSPSSVCYGNDTVVGNSSTAMSSFSDSVTKTVSGTSGSIWSTSNTKSTTYTQEQDTSTTIAVSQTTTNNQCLGAFQGFSFSGLNHDWDEVLVWLNPIASFALDNTTSPSQVVWTGYSWDPTDPVYPDDIDVFGIPVGCLNGDFRTTDPAEWTTCQSYWSTTSNPPGPLARTWALNNTDGSGPGLTGFGTPCNPAPNPMTDVCSILAADQFGNSSFTFTPPAPPNFSTPDGRFTACDAAHALCNTPIQYSPGNGKTYMEGYTTTTTQSQGYKNTYSTSYSVENKFQGTGWLSGFNLDLKKQTTLTWINGFSQSTNVSNGQTSTVTVVGPPPGYTGPSQFVLYQDNLYGTFMLNPQ